MAENVLRRKKAASSPIKRTAGERTKKAPRVKPVRITVDLDPVLHKQLKIFAIEADSDASSVIRALLTRLSTDPVLADHILQDIN